MWKFKSGFLGFSNRVFNGFSVFLVFLSFPKKRLSSFASFGFLGFFRKTVILGFNLFFLFLGYLKSGFTWFVWVFLKTDFIGFSCFCLSQKLLCSARFLLGSSWYCEISQKWCPRFFLYFLGLFRNQFFLFPYIFFGFFSIPSFPSYFFTQNTAPITFTVFCLITQCLSS